MSAETENLSLMALPEPIMAALKSLQKAAYRHGWVSGGDGDAKDSAAEFRHAVTTIAAALAPAPAAGCAIPKDYALVPVDLTPEMRAAFHIAHEQWEHGSGLDSPDHQWAALLAAAPTPRAAPEGADHQTTVVGAYTIEKLLRGEDVVTDRLTILPASDIMNERHRLVKAIPAPGAGVDLAGVEAATLAARVEFGRWATGSDSRRSRDQRFQVLRQNGKAWDEISAHGSSSDAENAKEDAAWNAAGSAAIAALGRDAAGRGGGADELPGLRRALKILRHPNAGMEPPDGGSPSETDRVRNVAEEIEELIARIAAEDRDRGADEREGE